MNGFSRMAACLLLILFLSPRLLAQQIGLDLDVGFKLYRAGNVTHVEALPGGKLMVLGDILSFGDYPALNIGRLHANGELDSSFRLDPVLNGKTVDDFALLSQGKILVATGDNLLFRLLPDGGLDTGFQSPAFNGRIRKLYETSDGRYLVCGDFTQVNGQPADELLRLLPNGSVDATFSVTLSSPFVSSLIPLPDGRMYLIGAFAPAGPAVVPVVRLLSSGALDPGFSFTDNTGSIPAAAFIIADEGALFPDGSLVVVGADYTNPSQEGIYLRVLPSGGVQNYFPAARRLSCVAISGEAQPRVFVAGPSFPASYLLSSPPFVAISLAASFSDLLIRGNELYLGGFFEEYNSVQSKGLARFLLDTGTDTTFRANILRAADLRSVDRWQGKLAVAGQLSQYEEFAVRPMVVLGADGTLEAQYATTAPSFVRTMPDNSFLVVDRQSTNSSSVLLIPPTPGSTASLLAQLASGPTPDMRSALPVDGNRILLAGNFFSANPPLVLHAGLLNIGLIGFDANFHAQAQWSSPTAAILQPNGQFLLASGRVSYVGISPRSLIRLNADLSLDSSMLNPGLLQTASGSASVFSLALQPDGRILVAGSFTQLETQPISPLLARFLPDGSLDTTWNVGAGFAFDGNAGAAHIDKILCVDSLICVIGNFNQYRGQPTMRGFAVLRPDASLDTRFVSDRLISGSVRDMQLSEDSLYVWIAGSFALKGGRGYASLARINLQGTLSTQPALEESGIRIYPNPVQAQLTLVNPGAASADWAIFDVQGRRLLSGHVPAFASELPIEVGHLPAGLYFLQMLGQGKIHSLPFLRQ